MQVALYNTLAGDNPLWSETIESVSVHKGNFSVSLGGEKAITLSMLDYATLYLEFQIDGVTLQGRKRILPVAHALRAQNGVPPGSIQAYLGDTAPEGWLVCDGSQVNVADHPSLYEIIGNRYGGDATRFNLPDLRERYLIGATGTPTAAVVGRADANQVMAREVLVLMWVSTGRQREETASISNPGAAITSLRADTAARTFSATVIATAHR